MLARNLHRRGNDFWMGADLAIEVVSDDAESRDRDLSTKRLEYANAGISEYWIVDPRDRSLSILTLEDGTYHVHGKYLPGQQARSLLLEGFAVDVTSIFAAASED
jgi:Uma2 family endonuclease